MFVKFTKKDKPRYNSDCTCKTPEELPGVKKESFVLPFAGGEIWFEHLDGIYQYTDLAVQKLRADAEIFRRPSSPGYITFDSRRNGRYGRTDFVNSGYAHKTRQAFYACGFCRSGRSLPPKS